MKKTKNPHYGIKLIFVGLILALGYFAKSYFKVESKPSKANTSIGLSSAY